MAQAHIILVEDEPNIALSLGFLLEREGYRVTHVADGADAVFEIQNARPALVILDVMLPSRSGLEILRDLRASAGLPDVPVLMLSAKGQARDKEAALGAGANLYMVKPFANAELVAEVTRLAGGAQDAAL